MSQYGKEMVSLPVSRYLLIFATGLLLVCFSFQVSAQSDPRTTPPPPPPHPKPKSLKEVVTKIKSWSIFKKHKDDPNTSSGTDNTTASAGNDKKSDPIPPPPNPKPQPDVIKPKRTTGTSHKATSVKKKKTAKPTGKTTTAPII
jgi:hypothetical protein